MQELRACSHLPVDLTWAILVLNGDMFRAESDFKKLVPIQRTKVWDMIGTYDGACIMTALRCSRSERVENRFAN